ncbi:MAG TPA: ATP-binding protein [Thermoanaerobaculia bacterium]|nr:ATP-binding protein [Thermoanaerobaculia bacterium]
MHDAVMTREELLEEVAKLRERLAEPEETVDAIRHGEVDAFVVLGAGGETIHTLGTGELLAQLQAVTDSLPVLVSYLDSELRYRFNSRLYESWFGLPLHEITGRRIVEVMGEAVFASLRAEIERALAGERVSFERWLDLPGAGRRCAEITLVPHRREAEVQGIVAFIQDVSERRRAEESLRLLADSGKLLSDSAGGAALLADAARLAVPALADWCCFALVEDGPGGEPGPVAAGRQPEPSVASSRLDVPLIARGRTLGTWSFVYAESGRHHGPEEREVAQELARRIAVALDNARLYRELEAANRAKDQFLAKLSHELRTPLTPVLAMATRLLAEDGGGAGGRRDGLAMIRRNVELEARLIDDLLDLTRIGLGKLDLRGEVTDLHQVVRQALETCDERELAARQVELDLAAGEHQVWGDPSRLAQVFWNLLSNALKFTPPGGTVQLRSYLAPAEPATAEPAAAGEAAGRQLVVSVADSGVGVDPQALPHIFDAFDQGEASNARRFGGLGLGLTISRAIVELHGGSLTAHSAGRDRGTTFVVRLPLAAGQAAMAARAGAGDAAAAGADHEPAPVRALHVLVVEDHADTAAAVASLLQAIGHRITVAGSVAAALAAADGDWPDLLVSDLGLPDGDGYELMRALAGRRPGLVGIALSGYGMTADIAQSREAGFALHLVKPVTLEALAEAVRRLAGGAVAED